jgi:Protein of unknown function (DUF3304)
MNATQMIRLTVMWLLIAASNGCNSQSPREVLTERATAPPAANTTPKAHNLTIYGYNYTDTGIGSFEVDGQGGGNVMVSEMDSGGGSGVCCISIITPMVKARIINIKWTRDLDTWCQQEVVLEPPIPSDAKRLEVHFYREGRIEIAVTGSLSGRMSSPPRVQLAAASEGSRHQDKKLNINNDSKFARCKLGYR